MLKNESLSQSTKFFRERAVVTTKENGSGGSTKYNFLDAAGPIFFIFMRFSGKIEPNKVPSPRNPGSAPEWCNLLGRFLRLRH